MHYMLQKHVAKRNEESYEQLYVLLNKYDISHPNSCTTYKIEQSMSGIEVQQPTRSWIGPGSFLCATVPVNQSME
jgi:hypothetical protein